MIDVQINGVSLSGSPLTSLYNELSYGGAVVDSGTTLWTLPSDAFYAALNSFGCDERACCTSKGSLTIIMPGVTLTVPEEALFDCDPSTSGCSADICWLYGLDDNGSYGTIMGQSVLDAYYTVYDQQNNRVGFAPATPNCIADPQSTSEPTSNPNSSPPTGSPAASVSPSPATYSPVNSSPATPAPITSPASSPFSAPSAITQGPERLPFIPSAEPSAATSVIVSISTLTSGSIAGSCSLFRTRLSLSLYQFIFIYHLPH